MLCTIENDENNMFKDENYLTAAKFVLYDEFRTHPCDNMPDLIYISSYYCRFLELNELISTSRASDNGRNQGVPE